MKTALFIMSLIGLLCLSGCQDDPCLYIENEGSNFSVIPTGDTPDGIALDDPFSLIDVAEVIDRQASEVEECLAEKFGENLENIPRGGLIAGGGFCHEDLGLNLDTFRQNITVKVSDDFHISHDGTQELLSLSADDSVCETKGLNPTKGACRYRVAVQNCDQIVITPSGYLFKDGLIRVITGCTKIWSNPDLAKCASPTVPAISGVEPTAE